MKLVYRIENLDCAHCAAEIEREIAKLDCIETVSLDFTSKLLHLSVQNRNGVLEQIQAAADRVEDGVVFHEKEHSHSHEHSHEHCNDRSEIIRLITGAALFAVGMVLHVLPVHAYIAKAVLLAAYLIMGSGVLYASLKTILKGRIFDENFLMSVATIGALCLGCWEEAAGVMLFFRAGELFEHLAVERSRKSIMEAIDLRPETAQLLKDGKVTEIPAERIQPGDILRVRVGDRIPVDGEIIMGQSALDTSAMTGESMPYAVSEGSTVISGFVNLSGVLEMRATAGMADSMVQRVLDSVENAAAGKPRIDRFITRFARIYTPIVVVVAALTAVIPSLITGNWSKWIYTALNFLMISCPCALVLSVPLSFFSGIGAGSRKGILFKDGISLEALSGIRAVVMDKTGTLTNGSFSVTEIESEKPEQLLAVCAACERASTHPIAQSILRYAGERGIVAELSENIREIAGKGIVAVYEGKTAACGNARLMEEQGITVPQNSGFGTRVHVSFDGNYLGAIVLADVPKEGAAAAVSEMRNHKLHTVMLTGDSVSNAEAIANTLGVAEVYAGLLPDEKLSYMQKVRDAHGRVLFVGDGINDAPVLSGADVGAAMGSGADAAMEAADLVFLASDPGAILTAMDIANRVNRTAKFNIVFALSIKLLIMLLGLLGYANMWLSVFADTGVTILCVLFVLWRIHFYYSWKK